MTDQLSDVVKQTLRSAFDREYRIGLRRGLLIGWAIGVWTSLLGVYLGKVFW